jgi:hypothetical protein
MGGGGNDKADLLAQISGQQWGMQKPAYADALNMLQSIMTTGGTQPRQGVIGQAYEQSARAGGKAREKTSESLSRTGIAGTPFGEDIMGQFDLQMFLDLAGLVTQMQEQDYWGHLQMLLPLLTQTMALPIQGLGAAAGAQAQERSLLEQASGFMGGLGSMNPVSVVTGT